MDYRDMAVPFSAKEVSKLRGHFKTIPTYTNGFIETSETSVKYLTDGMRWERTPEQRALYTAYWKKNVGDKISEDDYINFATAAVKTVSFALEWAIKIDKNNDGIISADEFETLLDLLSTTEAKQLSRKSYEDFMAEADTNQDGQVDLDECVVWIEKHIK